MMDDKTVMDQSIDHIEAAPKAESVSSDARHGHILEPQPTDSPYDPLNWSRTRKLSILFVISYCSCLADWAAAGASASQSLQAKEWHLTASQAYSPTAGNTIMLGAGGIVAVIFSAWIGRLPTLFWSTIIAAGTMAWCAASPSYHSYLAARILNGFFAVAAAGGGMMWIDDVFFAHERPRAVNVWAFAVTLAPFMGPCVTSAIQSVASWRDAMWMNLGLTGLALILQIIFGEETFFPRWLSVENIPNIYETSRIERLVGTAQVRTNYTTNSFLEACARPFKVLTKAPVWLINVYYFFEFGWVIANNTTISVFVIPEYKFGFGNLAALYAAPIIGALLALVIGSFMFQAIDKVMFRFNGGRLEAERRLIPIWFVMPLQIVGYNLVGCSLQFHWSYWVIAVGWGIHNFSLVVITASASAYLIDIYPQASGESSALLNLGRDLSGFILGYVQINWVNSMGAARQYGLATGIMAAAFVIFLVPLQIFGKRLRDNAKPLNLKTN